MRILRYFPSLFRIFTNWFKIYKIKNNSIEIGKRFSVGKFFRCEVINNYNGQKFTPRIFIGNNVHIEDFVHIGCTNLIEIGDNTVIASKVYITDHNHGYYDLKNVNKHENPQLISPLMRVLTNDSLVKIGMNVWIGENVTILPGSIIGDGAIIGANSVVNGVINEFSISVGSPAKRIKQYNFDLKKWCMINDN
ncbi:MAG: acyltransferase [Shewanella sp.]|jgi:lipopolysaccharide O-acetyltransferase|uniref:acyltransferase n=1 Tax=Shewanella sp. TaxID=50422 RepID=UPI0035665752